MGAKLLLEPENQEWRAMKKLVLNRETVRSLNEADLHEVAGGRPYTQTNCTLCNVAPAPSMHESCPPQCDTRWQCI